MTNDLWDRPDGGHQHEAKHTEQRTCTEKPIEPRNPELSKMYLEPAYACSVCLRMFYCFAWAGASLRISWHDHNLYHQGFGKTGFLPHCSGRRSLCQTSAPRAAILGGANLEEVPCPIRRCDSRNAPSRSPDRSDVLAATRESCCLKGPPLTVRLSPLAASHAARPPQQGRDCEPELVQDSPANDSVVRSFQPGSGTPVGSPSPYGTSGRSPRVRESGPICKGLEKMPFPPAYAYFSFAL